MAKNRMIATCTMRAITPDALVPSGSRSVSPSERSTPSPPSTSLRMSTTKRLIRKPMPSRMAAAMMFGIAEKIICSILLAGPEMLAILSCSSAAIDTGMMIRT